MVELAEQFRRVVQARSNGKRSPGRYTNQARDLALRYLAEVRGSGGRASQAARDLGVDANTLRLWEKRTRQSERPAIGRLLPVEVTDDDGRGAAPYAVHGPGGLRVDCGNAADVAALFRALA